MRLLALQTASDIPISYRNTPLEELIRYQNFEKPFEDSAKAKLLICMCMDSRKALRIPPNFAFVIRTGGANIRALEFKISYLVSMLGIEAIALIGHNDCRMVDLMSRKEEFICGMVEHAGWDRERAQEHFEAHAPQFQIKDEKAFIFEEQQRLSLAYPSVIIAPLLYDIDSNLLHRIDA